jgi:Zn-dependent protease/CBS domain-containing protein
MKWSFKIGRFAGIDVYLHFTFLLLLALIAYDGWSEQGNLMAALTGALLFLALFGCVLLHEFGHALTARHYGIKTQDITLLPIGGVARLERLPEKPRQELCVALAGPAVNVVIAALLLAWLFVRGRASGLFEVSQIEGDFVLMIFWLNCWMIGFNLLPAFPMDGGRVLRAFLAMVLTYARATRVAATIGQGMALVFAGCGLIGIYSGRFTPMLLFIALFVWMGASQEARMVEMKSAFSGISVAQAMLTRFVSLSPQQTLGEVVRLVPAGVQADFPVCEGDRVVGLLTGQDLLAALTRRGPTTLVGDVMRREFDQLSPAEPLEQALGRGRSTDLVLLPVTQGGALIGVLTMEHVREFLKIRFASAPPRCDPPDVPPRIDRRIPPRIRSA